jgi:hypothetical protein
MERNTSLQTTHLLQIRVSTVSACLNKQIIKKHQTTLASHHTSLTTLNPWLITGFADAEGCFHISITENKNYKTG